MGDQGDEVSERFGDVESLEPWGFKNGKRYEVAKIANT